MGSLSLGDDGVKNWRWGRLVENIGNTYRYLMELLFGISGLRRHLMGIIFDG